MTSLLSSVRTWSVSGCSDGVVILNTDENAPPAAVGERHDFLGQAFIMEPTAFELGDVISALFQDGC